MNGRAVPTCALWLASAALFGTGTAAAQVTISGRIQYWDPIAGRYESARDIDVKVHGDWWFADPRTRTDDSGNYSVQVDDPKGLKKQFNNVRVEAFAQTPGIVQVFAHMLAPKPYSAVSRAIDGVTAGQGRTRDLWIGGASDNVRRTPYGNTEATAAAFVVHREMQAHYRDLRSRAFTADDFDERGGPRVGGVEVIVPAVGVTSYYNTATGFVNLIPGGACVSFGAPCAQGPATDWPAIQQIGPHPFLDPAVSFFLATVRHEYSHAIHDEMTGGGILTGLTLPTVHSPVRESPYPAVAYTEGFAEFLPLVSLGQGGSYEPTVETDPSPGGLPIPVASPPGTHDQWEGEFTGFLWDLFDPTGIETVRHRATTTENDGASLPTDVVDAQVWRDAIEDADLSRIRRAVREPMPGGHIPQRVREYLANYARLYGSQDLHSIKTIAFNRDLMIPGVDERPAQLEGMGMEHLRRLSYRFDVVEPDPEDRTSIRVTLWYEPPSGLLEQILDLELGTGWSGDRREVAASYDAAGRGGEGYRLWALVNDGMLPTAYRFDVPEVDQEQLADLLDGVVPDPPEQLKPGVVPQDERPVVGPEDLAVEPRPGKRGGFRIWNLAVGPVCRGRRLVAERPKEGQPPSDRICESRDVLVRGEDICIWSGERRSCTWWGFEFDYENADPSVPLTCTTTRSVPGDEGNYEGIRNKNATTATGETPLGSENGHQFSPGYELFIPAATWLVVDMHLDCTYGGEPAFEADVRVIHSSAFSD
ncbi:MAG TPA: hypothetical protein VFP76_00990 [Gemmatimonadota bacterium]|nr:hypothetical protein [Gemmatimonadota bacterium]